MGFKKRMSGSWTNTPNYIHNTATDTITTLPADIYTNGTTATVGLKGNMEQNGTPTPDNPITPSECGDLETVGGQYKIPISSAGQTTTVYLGEVETTRKIKKLMLTGEETFNKNDQQSNRYLYYAIRSTIFPSSILRTPVLCNELPVVGSPPQDVIGINAINNFSVIYFNFGADVMNAQPSGNTVEGLKEYLAQQYAAGTPVIIWYVLAEPETGIVNEPLRKIGDYADEVSGITIPTIAGGDTIDVDTTLKPSEVSVNYKGWHSITDVHRFNGTSWN